MLKLVKVLYLADRKALVEWHRTITGDKFFALRNGPIVSRIYDLIRERIYGADMDAWKFIFNPLHDNTVSLKGEVNTRPLSKREMDALKWAFGQLRNLSIGEVIKRFHRLPEWKDPGESSAPIDPKTILLSEGLQADAICQIDQELQSFQAAKIALQAV